MTLPDPLRPIATVDAALLTLRDDRLCVGLLDRDRDPFAGVPALPGGYVHVDEDLNLQDTAARILQTKAHTTCRFLEQLGTFSGAQRDPRGWSLSVAYFALVPDAALDREGPLTFHPVDDLPPLAFDHTTIITAAVERLRGKSSYFALPAFLLPPTFTMADLHDVYERVLGTRIDRASFRRKIADQDIVEPVDGSRRTGPHRPATLYRLGPAGQRPFIYRI